MTRFEFSHKLRKALSGRVSHSVVNENVAYYENYIDAEIKKGRSEKEVLEELGDPRLIAKTIINTAGADGIYTPEAENAKNGRAFDGTFSGRTFSLPLWIGLLILLLICMVVFKIVGLVLGALLPLIVPVALVYLLIRYLQNR